MLEEKLGGTADPQIAEVCRKETPALVTLDRGLGNIRAYPPADYHGIVVLRPRDQNVDAILALTQTFVALLETNSLAGALWIVEITLDPDEKAAFDASCAAVKGLVDIAKKMRASGGAA